MGKIEDSVKTIYDTNPFFNKIDIPEPNTKWMGALVYSIMALTWEVYKLRTDTQDVSATIKGYVNLSK